MTCFTRHGDIEIAYQDLGGAGGDPLLLVMGLAASRFWWPQGLVDELLGQGFHVVAYDQRDAGQSTHLPDRADGSGRRPIGALLRRRAPAYTGEDLADDAIAVLDAVGWSSAHLFGHSMGGLLAQRIAIRHPDRVRSLTSSSAVPSDVSGLAVLRYLRLGTVARFARLRLPEGPDADLAFAELIGRTMAPAGQAFGPEQAAVFRELAAREAAHGVVSFRDPKAQSRQIGATWHGGRLADITAPALILHGGLDPLVRVAAARALAAAIPGARLTAFPTVGHFLPPDSWPAYAAAIRTLASRADLARPAA
ncbi:alpha/beta fold hydrolase [Kitasatospora sp. NBC_01302]|uniref:alpha/beta fold hydrolase n=1 Tax=Kitasatospora sp. NBC_01302 TaxID=2903575 RepID=UPI002E0DDA39|nr:alpha/beta fold hydrolase [Kitasatospora sp. NBC_01302]